ncbi:TIGR04282 family arsenosugar biosynthesis glycosyltransferase [Salidesulfovibrio brasiliensis]|uniref:TIGR04282 family arsenosugar biosynthesis glycosyltransferase n=1 Tax=Salidesulfovibrio brasiliensis TaxID=221711 RepID=UPI0006D26225|nr:TIGR04282 family arsenosugar biosynthesis glycosyltransferase [Salidesulfovibrio brasiliensis]
MNGCILLFVKLPIPGRVKTRLASETSDEAACELYRALVEGVLARLEALEVDVVVCYAPEDARPQMVEWLGTDKFYLSQKGADLGRRMENAFRETFFMGYDRAVLVGSDIPGLDAEECMSALRALSPKRASVGAAGDGGYYLIGFDRRNFVPQALQASRGAVPTCSG